MLVNDTGCDLDGFGRDSAPAHEVVEEIRSLGGSAVANLDSVATRSGAYAIVNAAVKAYGRVDVLVNNAGIQRDKSFLEMDDETFDGVLSVDLKGSLFCSQAFAKQVISQGSGGRIVHSTIVIGTAGQTNYAAAKAGTYGLMRMMAIELAPHGITVNTIAPLAHTRMTESLPNIPQDGTLSPAHAAPGALFLGSSLCGDRTSIVLAVVGSRVCAFKMAESEGRISPSSSGIWTAKEIDESWGEIYAF